MTEQTPNEVDRSGQKVGMWTEVDSHGGVKVGEYVEGKRQGVWRHYFVEWVGALGGHVRQRRSGWAWTWYRSTGDLLSVGVSWVPRSMVLGALGSQWET